MTLSPEIALELVQGFNMAWGLGVTTTLHWSKYQSLLHMEDSSKIPCDLVCVCVCGGVGIGLALVLCWGHSQLPHCIEALM